MNKPLEKTQAGTPGAFSNTFYQHFAQAAPTPLFFEGYSSTQGTCEKTSEHQKKNSGECITYGI